MIIFFVWQIVIIEHKSIICPGYNAVLHIHTCIEEVEITVSFKIIGVFVLRPLFTLLVLKILLLGIILISSFFLG